MTSPWSLSWLGTARSLQDEPSTPPSPGSIDATGLLSVESLLASFRLLFIA